MLRFHKASPDIHAIAFRDGNILKHGRGISFYYLPSVTTVLELPATAISSPFFLNELTANFQDVTLQGNVNFRISDPLVVSERFDFSLAQRRKPAGDGREKLTLFVTDRVQFHARARISSMTLEDVLRELGGLNAALAEALTDDPALAATGITIEAIHLASARAQPDVHKALQTEHREKIQRQADLAIYARRSAAVENEKEIKQRELATEIELATRRKQIVETQAQNTIRMAEAEAQSSELKLAVYKSLDPTVMAIMAVKEWAEKGGAISNLTVTPDMIGDLIGKFTQKVQQ
jgi:hypothetical protein